MTLQGSDYVIIIEDGHLERVSDIAEAMGAAGMSIRTVMADTGVIFAVLDEHQAVIVREMGGVLQAEPGKTMHILA